ncbi:LON Protease, partial [Daphnia magna]
LVGRGLQPLQAPAPYGRHQGHGRAVQEQHPLDRPHRLRQDPAGSDPGALAECALRHRRRDHADRSGLCGRGCREHHPEAAAELQLRRRARPA